MEKGEKIEAYYEKEHPFKDGISELRALALKTDAAEDYKWNFPVYTVNGKNVFGICKFKNHFGVWFFNGAFLSDPKKILQNAQEGKTKGMRHWKFESLDAIDHVGITLYLNEAIQNQKDGKEIVPEKSKGKVQIPNELKNELTQNKGLNASFASLTPFKQKEFCEYISEAKQEKTKLRRLEKILPMIEKGIGLNDAYR